MASTLLTPVKWTVDEYHQMIAAGVLCDRRVELLNGDVVEMAPVEPPHEGMSDAAIEHLRERLGRRVLVRAGKAVTLPTSEPLPDITIVERRDYSDHHPFPENIYLLIEIANSRPEPDLEVKRPVYARAGIPEYWVFDLVNNELHVFRDVVSTGDGADYQADIIWQDDEIAMQAFPDVALSVAAMKRLIV